MCCCLSSEPVEDQFGRYKTYKTNAGFATSMIRAPCAGMCTLCWFLGQVNPLTCGITQYCLRRKVLEGDMSKYRCCQGYYTGCCCCKAMSCGEQACPSLCMCIEGCCCNCVAVSSSRMLVMEKYNLSSDPCDFALIHCSNALMCLSCLCSLLTVTGLPYVSEASCLIHILADAVYATVSGCMTAQTAHEMDYQLSKSQPAKHTQLTATHQGVKRQPSQQGRVSQAVLSANPTGVSTMV